MATQPPEKRTGPTQDPLEVGLARHRKRQPLFPPWVEERLGWFGIIALIVLFGLPVRMIFNLAGPPPPPSVAPTRLAVTFGPAKVWKEGTSSHLKSVTIKLRNVGSARAFTIRAFARARSIEIPLTGPETLEPGVESSYTAEANISLLQDEQLTISAGCANCPVQ